MALDFRNSCLKNFNELLIYNLRQRNCNINMVKKLLAHKVDVNYKDCFLNTSLHYVVQNCSDKLDLIREILNMEGNPNAVNAEGNSPLHLAVLKSNVHVILELIKFGGDVRLANKRGNTPLHVAAMRGKACIIETLLKSDTSLINCGNIRGNTPLHIAVIHGKSYVAEMLIRHGANINSGNVDGNTPLHMAIIHDKEDMIKTLISSGADLNCSNHEGNAPLHLYVVRGKANIVQILLNNGANSGSQNLEGNAIIHVAATYNRVDVVELLIEFNADVSCYNHEYITPMHIAAINGNCKLIRKLTDKGAHVDCSDLEGNTPLHLAVLHNQFNVIESLVVNGAEHVSNNSGYTPLHIAIIDNKFDMIKTLLVYGADIDCRDANDNTPLHLAAIYDRPCIVVKLVESGAKTDLTNQDGHTPVQVAALHGNVNIINVLFQNGVRVKLRNQGRRYINSFTQSLLPHPHPNPLFNAALMSESPPGATGASQNNSTASGSSQPSTNLHSHSVVNTVNSIAPAGHPVTSYSFSPISSTAAAATTLHEMMLQEIGNLGMEANPTPLTAQPPFTGITGPVPTTGASSQPAANVASSSHAVPLSAAITSIASQILNSIVSSSQGSNQASNQNQSAQQTSIQSTNSLPVVTQVTSQTTNSVGSLGNLPSGSNSGIPLINSNFGASFLNSGIPSDAFADIFFEPEPPYVLEPLNLGPPPSLASVQAWSALQGSQVSGGPTHSTASNNVAQQVQNTYVAFLDELDAEGDPMSWSWSPFLRNSRMEETSIIDNLVKFYGINGRNRSGNEYLQRALINDNPNEIASLLRCGTGNIKSNRRENSFLHLAAVYGKPKLVKALIQSGVSIDCKNNELNTPLHFAAFCGEAEVIDLLIQSGANLDIMNRRGATPLKYAFSYCRESVLKTLGRYGANRFLFAAKTLVKYDVLRKGLYLTRHKVLKANCVYELLSYVEECCNEVLRMKQKYLGKNFSFFQFVNQALTCSEPLKQNPYFEAAVEYLIEISRKNDYTIYYNILVYLIAKKADQDFWQKKLLDLVDSAVEEGKINLNRKLFSSISQYVSNIDMFNLLLAFTNAKSEN